MAFQSNLTLVVDTSVLIAILLHEEGWQAFAVLLRDEPFIYLSAATYLELFVVVQRRLGSKSKPAAERLLGELRTKVVPFDHEQAEVARTAYATYGKGRHPAALNFGDCFSYALAKHLNQPLLFKGNDFSQTDVLIAETA